MAAATGVASGQRADSWPQFGYGAANTGYAPENAGPVGGVSESWRVERSGTVTSLAVANDTVYVATSDGLYALDSLGGSERWQVGTESVVHSAVAVSGDTVHFASDETVYALDASDGSERWRVSVDGGISAGPAVTDDTLYVCTTDVYALDASDGSERWRFDANERIRRTPAVADGTVYAGDDGGTLYALDADGGSERWRVTVDGGVGTPAVASGVVYAGGYESPLYALETADGSERWTAETDRGYPSPSVADGTVYVERNGGVSALNAADGSERWSFGMDGLTGKPAVIDDTVYVGGTQGVYAIYANDGDRNWRFGLPDWARAPVVADGTVYVNDAEDRVYALEDGLDRVGSAGADLPVLGPSGELLLERVWPGVVASVFVLCAGVLWWGLRGGGDVDADRPRDDDRPTALERIRDDDGDEGEPDGISWPEEDIERLRNDADEGGGAGTAGEAGEGAAEMAPEPDPAADLIDDGDGLEVEATNLVAAGEYDRALSLVDDARAAYREAREAASGSDAVDAATVEERLDRLAGTEREIYGARFADDPGSLREAVGRAEALADRATEEGFDDRREAAARDRRRGDLPAEAGRADRPGPPESIPRAPDVTVDYDALTDEEPIGAGGNADVTRATLPTADGEVTLAIKRPRMQGTLHTDAVERLLEEAETWDRLGGHDHVVGVVDYGAEPLPWIAMEYMDAGDLGERAGAMEFEQARWTAVALAKGVRHAHRHGVVHLDLKPANVLFRSVEGAWDVPKVADWGLSKHLLEHSKSVEGLSPGYAAPEQFDEEYGEADDVTDVYQLGAVLYELFTGEPPFEGKPAKAMHRVLHEEPTPPSAVADVPEALDDVLLTALSKEKADRYESVLYLRDGLRNVPAE